MDLDAFLKISTPDPAAQQAAKARYLRDLRAAVANITDPFGAMVAGFEAEAPATLAVPQRPTAGMIEAGAQAAGITPAQFEAAYTAAITASQKERAA